MTEYFWWLAALLLVGGGGLVLVLSARMGAPDAEERGDRSDPYDEDEPGAVT